MSSVSGNLGQNPNPIPEDPNNRLDNAEASSRDQGEGAASGVTETGLSVDVVSTGQVSTISPAITGIQNIASEIMAVGVPTALPPTLPEAAGFVEEVATDFFDDDGLSREDSENLEEAAADLFAGVSESKELVDGLRGRLANFQKTQPGTTKQTSRKSRLEEGEDAPDLEEQFLDLRRNYAVLNGRANQLESNTSRFMADLANMHRTLMNVSLEEFYGIFGGESDRFRADLQSLGIIYDNGGWRIYSQGVIPRLTLEAQNLRTALENLYIPTEEEFIKAATEDISCCRALINRLKALWNTLVQMFHALYDKALFYLFWLAKKIRRQQPLTSQGEKNPKFENPFASTSGSTGESESTASVRSSVSGRGDISDEEMIRRPEDNTVETQDVDNQDEESREDTEGNSQD